MSIECNSKLNFVLWMWCSCPRLCWKCQAYKHNQDLRKFYLSSTAFFLKDVSGVKEYKVQRLFKIAELAHFKWNREPVLKGKTIPYSWAQYHVWIGASLHFETQLRKGEHSQQTGTQPTYKMFSVSA